MFLHIVCGKTPVNIAWRLLLSSILFSASFKRSFPLVNDIHEIPVDRNQYLWFITRLPLMLAFPEFDGLLKLLVTIIISSGTLRDDIKLV